MGHPCNWPSLDRQGVTWGFMMLSSPVPGRPQSLVWGTKQLGTTCQRYPHLMSGLMGEIHITEEHLK